MSQQTNVYPPDLPTLGLKGIAATIANFSMAVVFVAVSIIGGWIAISFVRETVTDLKQEARDERRERAAAAEKAHRDFLDDRKEDRDSRRLMWQAIEKQGEQTKNLAEEMKKGNNEMQAQMKTLIDEVKKKGMGGP